jgi:hypothetical protein
MRIGILLALCLVGCATQKDVYLPDGRKAHAIECSGAALSWNLCTEKAGKICKARGYEIVEKNEERGTTVAGSAYGVIGGDHVTRTLVIACK